jgi:hypothetical protein
MRYLIIVGLILLTALTSFAGRKRADRTGSIQDNIYTDAEYGFSLTIHDQWKSSTGKEGDLCRLKLVDKDPEGWFENKRGSALPWLTAPSKMEVWVVTGMDSARHVLDSILAEKSEGKLHKEFRDAVQPDEGTAVFRETLQPTRSTVRMLERKAQSWTGIFRHALSLGTNDLNIDVAVKALAFDVSGYVLVVVISNDVATSKYTEERVSSMLATLKVAEPTNDQH